MTEHRSASLGSRKNVPFLPALVALTIAGCAHPQGALQQSTAAGLSAVARPQPELTSLAEAAAAGERTATARLREAGPAGLAALLAAYDQTPPVDAPRRQRLSAAIDTVAQQKDARTSRLYWYTDLAAAMTAAQATGKPILSLRLLGNLNDEFSCANSRFFRIALYPNREVNQLLAERFILHWSSERPAPVVTIDFRDGRTLKRTVTGNSLHYVLDSQGRVVDAIPGLLGPGAFARVITRAAAVAQEVAPLSGDARRARLVRYHDQALAELRGAWPSALAAAELSSLPFPPDAVMTPQPTRVASPAPPPSALMAMNVAPSKAVVETPMVRAFIQRPPVELSAYAETLPWQALAKVHAADCRLDAVSRALVRDKHPRSWSDTSAMGRSLTDGEFANLVQSFEASMAADTVKNLFLHSGVLHGWLLAAARSRSGADSFVQLNERIYAELFRTPASDPWLGLLPPAGFSAIQDDGILEYR